jgi:Chlamydia polymorphic membrane protein (Chlamydia_PMP) repeat
VRSAAFAQSERGLTALLVLLAVIAGGAAYAATITVTTTADPGTASDCSLRSAMTAALSQTATDACVKGDGNDFIVFKGGVTGTILLTSSLPVVTKGMLTITGPGGSPGVTIDVTAAQTAFGLKSPGALTLAKLIIVNAGDTAVVNLGGMLTIDHCTLFDNAATSSGGGAILAISGATIITDSTFSGNSSTIPGHDEIGGGAILVSSPPDNPASLNITGSTFHHNHSARDGGAILSLDSTVTIVNSTFADNSSETGGGAIWDTESSVAITNSTFSKNTISEGHGGAVYNFEAVSLSLKGTLLSGKAAGGNCFGTIADAGYNISDDDSCGFSGTSRDNTDPKLNPAGLADNGGPTQTIALQVGSPAVDAIPAASCTDQATPMPNPLKTDQRGVTRPDPEDIGNPACDIGAYELVECTGAFPSLATVFPPNHKFVSESVMGVTGVTITGVFQDEPVGGKCPDATGVGTDMAQVRAERNGGRSGRTYHIQFSASDAAISSACLGEVKVCVPHDRKHLTCTDEGALFDSTRCGPRR